MLNHNKEEHSFCSKEEQSLNLDKVGTLQTKFTTIQDHCNPITVTMSQNHDH